MQYEKNKKREENKKKTKLEKLIGEKESENNAKECLEKSNAHVAASLVPCVHPCFGLRNNYMSKDT